jgi:hypothetical protein
MKNIKRVGLIATVLAGALLINTVAIAERRNEPAKTERCLSCAEKAAIKQSIAEALAASMAAANAATKNADECLERCSCNKPKPPYVKPSLPFGREQVAADDGAAADDQKEDQACCEACAANKGNCSNTRCIYYAGKRSASSRAEREPAADVDSAAFPVVNEGCDGSFEADCLLNQRLDAMAAANAACCKVIHRINDRVKSQGRHARRCCSQLNDKLDDIETLILSQTDDAAACCSVIESLILSQTDDAAACCSVIESLILSQTDDAAACCSVIDIIQTLALSQIDQTAACCSTTDALFGDPCVSVMDIPQPASIIDFLDNSCIDMFTLLKSIYAVVAQIYYCTCQIP